MKTVESSEHVSTDGKELISNDDEDSDGEECVYGTGSYKEDQHGES